MVTNPYSYRTRISVNVALVDSAESTRKTGQFVWGYWDSCRSVRPSVCRLVIDCCCSLSRCLTKTMSPQTQSSVIKFYASHNAAETPWLGSTHRQSAVPAQGRLRDERTNVSRTAAALRTVSQKYSQLPRVMCALTETTRCCTRNLS